ncbi:UPAR/Ly6 domain-containing protein bero-like isoform X2 [Musca autumnalis]|uniref:UPAR/Ly6 domain-containing protein bero-like isoform X2 n=1 Tax=Musca autumnalis TaxID=221902 RepID=UPI003CEB0E50
MTSTKYFLVLAIIIASAGSAVAVHCYQCDASQNPKCGEIFEPDDSMKIDCSRIPAPFYATYILGRNASATGCVKRMLQKLTGEPYIARSCFYGDFSNPKGGCEMDTQTGFTKQISCSACSDDFCNSSTAAAPIIVTILTLLVMTRIFS